ncbi:MAG: glucose 1-dehydrogenase [Candidatus Binatia bacterium]|nr:glucose 1-dehydrogenase [Candidatus Binatia bacterium]
MTDQAFDISGKVTIVTGGGTGIGAEIAREFCRRGAKVMITSRTMDHLGPVAEGIRNAGGTVEAMVCDVRHNDQVEAVVQKTVETWGRVDILINNAGASFVAHAHEISPNGFATIVAINLNGTFLFSRAVARVMIAKQTGGNIINISSDAGVYGSATMCHYGAAKAGVINLTRSLAIEWAPYGIRVNCISPGPIETEGVKEVLWPTPELQERAINATALKRFGTGLEIAWPCVFLASKASGYITGVNLQVDGCMLRSGSPESRLIA